MQLSKFRYVFKMMFLIFICVLMFLDSPFWEMFEVNFCNFVFPFNKSCFLTLLINYWKKIVYLE